MVEWMTVEVSDLDNRFMETDPYLIINIGMLVYKQNGHTQGRQSRSMVTGYLEIQILLLNDPSRQITIQLNIVDAIYPVYKLYRQKMDDFQTISR